MGNRAKDFRLVLGPTVLTVLGFWFTSGGISPIEAVARAEALSLLPTTAAIRVFVSETMDLRTLSAEASLFIIGMWTVVVLLIMFTATIISWRRRQ